MAELCASGVWICAIRLWNWHRDHVNAKTQCIPVRVADLYRLWDGSDTESTVDALRRHQWLRNQQSLGVVLDYTSRNSPPVMRVGDGFRVAAGRQLWWREGCKNSIAQRLIL